MVAPKEQFACSSSHSIAEFRRSVIAANATVSTDNLGTVNARQWPRKKNRSFEKPIDKVINTRNAIIALFIMLILLLTLQAPAFYDDAVTSELALPPAAKQPLQPVQLIPATVNELETAQDSAKTEAQIIQTERPATGQTEPAKTHQTTIKLASAETTISNSAPATDVPVLELAAIAPASGSSQEETATNEDINIDAAATLSVITGTGYVKIAHSGEYLDDQIEKWECVEDKHNNLTWEVKKNDGGIRDKDFSYSWLREIDGEIKGVRNGGRCKGGVKCDTSSYVRAMNEQKLCGYSDWRLPTKEELETLVVYNDNPKEASINKTYFPEAIPSWYWSASEHPQRKSLAWYVLFRNGIALNDLKERPKHIRLVRGTIEQ